MRLRLIQKDVNDLNLTRHLDSVPTNSADIVCFPELAATGCLYEGGEIPNLDGVMSMLSRYDFSVFLGLPRRDDKGLRNSYLYFRDGRYQFYDKINLFEPMNENIVYVPGREPGVIETGFGRFGVAICYDLRFPDLFDRMVEREVDWILVPAAFPKVRIGDWADLIVERAKQTGRHVIGVNAVGDDGVNLFGGTSMVAAPDGRILTRAGDSLTGTIDVNL